MDELKKGGLAQLSRKEVIYSKGFDMLHGGRDIEYRTLNNEYRKIKVGTQKLDDAVLDLGAIRKNTPRNLPFGNKAIFY